VKRRIYLTLERGRDIVFRNLLRKVYVSGGFEPLKEGQTETDAVRRTRIPVAEFAAAMRLSFGQNNGEVLEDDEVECLLANMIYKVRYLFIVTFVSHFGCDTLLVAIFRAYRGGQNIIALGRDTFPSQSFHILLAYWKSAVLTSPPYRV
jgi:hypothetical protein